MELTDFITGRVSVKKKLKYVGLAVEEGQNKISVFFEDVNKLKREIKTDSGKFAAMLSEKLEGTKIKERKNNEFFCKNNEMNIKINGSFQAEREEHNFNLNQKK